MNELNLLCYDKEGGRTTADSLKVIKQALDKYDIPYILHPQTDFWEPEGIELIVGKDTFQGLTEILDFIKEAA